MIEKIKAYFETLDGLSAKELDQSAEKLVRAEKRNVALLIAHIAEMSRRKADLECGYKNIFHYCVTRLHLSEGSVAMRLQVAKFSSDSRCTGGKPHKPHRRRSPRSPPSRRQRRDAPFGLRRDDEAVCR